MPFPARRFSWRLNCSPLSFCPHVHFDSRLQYHSGQVSAGEQTYRVFFGKLDAFSRKTRCGRYYPPDLGVSVIHAVFLSREIPNLLNSPVVCHTRMKFGLHTIDGSHVVESCNHVSIAFFA